MVVNFSIFNILVQLDCSFLTWPFSLKTHTERVQTLEMVEGNVVCTTLCSCEILELIATRLRRLIQWIFFKAEIDSGVGLRGEFRRMGLGGRDGSAMIERQSRPETKWFISAPIMNLIVMWRIELISRTTSFALPCNCLHSSND